MGGLVEERAEDFKMSQTTTYLSRLLGLYLMLMALVMFVNKQALTIASDVIAKDSSYAFLWGTLTMTAGLAMVIAHNRWLGGAPTVVVTVIGWLALLKGIAISLLSPASFAANFAAVRFQDLYYFYAGFALALGAYLTYAGFRRGASS